MLTFAPVDLPDAETGRIRRWITSEPMKALVTAYGESLPDAGVGDLLAWLDAFSGEHWDFRRPGRVERDQVKPPAFDAGRTELILAAGTALGMVEPARPPVSGYRHLLVLGGLARSCLERSRYAAELVLSGAVRTGDVAALGSFRPLGDAEKDLPGLGEARFEVDALDAGMRLGFGLTEPAGRATTYRPPGLPAIHVLAAPSSEPGVRRANTADTYRFWAQRARLRPTDRLLIVTSPIYVPFQHADAIRMLGLRYGCGIDTIGCDTAAGPQSFQILQEVRSAVISMRRLHEALP